MTPRRRAHRDVQTIGWRGVLVLVLVVAAITTVVLTPWMGRGLALLLPTPAAQAAVGVSLPLAVVVLFAAGTRRPRGTRFPPALAASISGLAATMWLLAPIGPRGGASGAQAAASVVVLVLTTYASWPILAVALGALAWWDRRRRADDVDPPPAARAGLLPPLRSWLIAASLPVFVAALTVTVGLLVGPPPVPPLPPITTTADGFALPHRVEVPELSGTLLEQRVDTVERSVQESEYGLRLAEQLGVPSIDRLWSVVAPTAAPPGDARPILVEFAVADLPGIGPPAVVAPHLVTADGGPLGSGWQRLEEPDRGRWVTAAVLHGRTVFRLRVIHGADEQARNAALLTLTEQLTADRLEALATATRPRG